MKTISIDYDGTFSSDPRLWSMFIVNAMSCGYTVLCISARIDRPESRQLIKEQMPDGVCIYLTNHNPKKEWIERRNIQVDIWIDDNPFAIFNSDNPEKQLADNLVASGI